MFDSAKTTKTKESLYQFIDRANPFFFNPLFHPLRASQGAPVHYLRVHLLLAPPNPAVEYQL